MRFGIFFFAFFSQISLAQFNCHESIHYFFNPDFNKIAHMRKYLESAQVAFNQKNYEQSHFLYYQAYLYFKTHNEPIEPKLKEMLLLTAMLSEMGPMRIYILLSQVMSYPAQDRTIVEFKELIQKDFPTVFTTFTKANSKKLIYFNKLDHQFRFRLSQYNKLNSFDYVDRETAIKKVATVLETEIKKFQEKAEKLAREEFVPLTTHEFALSLHKSRNVTQKQDVLNYINWEVSNYNFETQKALLQSKSHYIQAVKKLNDELNLKFKILALDSQFELSSFDNLNKFYLKVDLVQLSDTKLAELNSLFSNIHYVIEKDLVEYFKELKIQSLYIENLKKIKSEIMP